MFLCASSSFSLIHHTHTRTHTPTRLTPRARDMLSCVSIQTYFHIVFFFSFFRISGELLLRPALVRHQSDRQQTSQYRRLGRKSRFECHLCQRHYGCKGSLMRHLRYECMFTASPNGPGHKCPWCSYQTRRSDQLRAHMKKHQNYELKT